MKLEGTHVGSLMMYGSWSDTHETQFLVEWGEAGNFCTVIMLGGCDYGGGVTQYADVPLKEAEAVMNSDLRSEYDFKEAMGALVAKYKKEEVPHG